jgi:hypothetical protein
MTTTYDYPPEDIENPRGNNNMTARAKFYQRSLYKEVVYPDNIVKPLDAWYDKNLYGKVDQEQNTIIPKQEELVQISRGVSPNLYCLNFVNDAFTAFAEHMQAAYLSGCVSKGGNAALYNVRATTAYVDSPTKWRSHRDAIINAFARNYNGSRTHPISNFNVFKEMFTKYLIQLSKSIPITKTNFILSSDVSSFGSGLKVGVAQLDCGNDAVKYDGYVGDVNFEFYAAAAKKFGFIIDKYAPWMLMYDLFTDASMHYINGYLADNNDAITPDNFFNIYYTPTYTQDIADLEQFIYTAYDRFVALKPIYEAEKTVYRAECEQLYQLDAKYRQPRAENQNLTSKELIDLLLILRYYESDMSGPPVATIRKRAYEIYRTANPATDRLALVAIFINESYRQYVYPSSYNKVNLGLDTTEYSRIIDTVAEVAVAVATSTSTSY